MLRWSFAGSLALLLSISLSGQPADNRSALSIRQIMQGEAFVGYLPESVRWSVDSENLYFSWNPKGDTLRSTYRTDAAGTAPQQLSPQAERRMVTGGDYNDARDQLVYERFDDLYWMNLNTGERRRITHTADRESNPQFSGDEDFIVYEREDNLYRWSLDSGYTEQLTDFRKGAEEQAASPPEYRQWLENDQYELFRILRERKAEETLREKRREQIRPNQLSSVYYGSKILSDLRISPDQRYLTCRLITSANGENTMVPNYVDESGYIEEINARSKVGSPQNTYELGIYDRQRDTFYTVDTKQIEGIYDKPAYLAEYLPDTATFKATYEKAREVIFHGPFYAPDGKAAVVVRSLDNKDRWIMQLHPEDGRLSLLDRQRDNAWVGGPGISSWNFSAGNIGWMPDGEHLWFQSEESGYSHLYTLEVATGEKRALTSGEFEIRDAELSHDGSTFFITANAENPHEKHFYHLPADGGELQKLTTRPGNYQVSVSPDEAHLAIRYSFSNEPWELFVMDNRPGAEMKRVTQSTTAAFEDYDWRAPEIVRFRARDGVAVPARLYRPENPEPDGPAVIFVHGAGYLQNVHRWWSSYYREYMFHNMLVDYGYTVLDIDYRGSDGYGRDWRTAIYRHMGGQDLEDQVDGAGFLAAEYGIDAGRIGVYGGSYGGFITLMALFNAPGTFQCGAALRSVTDWAHYNHPYTSNILNTPMRDSLAYHRSSPIYHAEGLEDRLLILHGMIDDNVQFQDVVRLAQRLIELGKEDWDFAVFPLERHGFVEPSSWTDEYRRIFELFEAHLK